MVINIQLIRVPESRKLVIESEKKRGRNGDAVHHLADADLAWRLLQKGLDDKRHELHIITDKIAAAKAHGKPIEELIDQARTIKYQVEAAKFGCDKVLEERNQWWKEVGNVLDPKVKVSQNEEDKVCIRKWAPCPSQESASKKYEHNDLLSMIGGVNYIRGSAVALHRGYYLLGPGTCLAQAIQRYAIEMGLDLGYTAVQPPYFLKEKVMAECAELADFRDVLYKVDQSNSDEPCNINDCCKSTGQKENLYLIATSEQPLLAFHMDSVIRPKDLPCLYLGISPCFRKEAGAHGSDTRGIFRVHQFQKIEQFAIEKPEDSNKRLDAFVAASTDLLTKLGIPHRVVTVVSSELNNAASLKYDVEGYFPGSDTWRELVSATNCTDYQARDVDLKVANEDSQGHGNDYPHTINATLAAVERLLCCVLENYQNDDGISVPPVLLPYMRAVFIPFQNKA